MKTLTRITAVVAALALVTVMSACTTVQTPYGPKQVLSPAGAVAIQSIANIGASTLAGYAFGGKTGAQSAAIGSVTGTGLSALLGTVLPQGQTYAVNSAPPPQYYYPQPPTGYYRPQPPVQYSQYASPAPTYSDPSSERQSYPVQYTGVPQPAYANNSTSVEDQRYLTGPAPQ